MIKVSFMWPGFALPLDGSMDSFFMAHQHGVSFVSEAGAAALEKAYLTPRKTAPTDATIEEAIGTPLRRGKRVNPIGRPSAMLTAQEEAERVSKRIRAEEAEAKQAQQPAAREPARPAENPTADTQRRRQLRVSITVKSSHGRALELLQSTGRGCSPWG